LALPYTAFSVYYQWKVEKQWCVLCLAVQVVLLLGAINILVNSLLLPFSNLSIGFVAVCLFVYCVPVLAWFTIKPMVLRLQEGKNTKLDYVRLKFNSEIFDTILKKQKRIKESTEGLGIDLGNASAKNTLVKVCSPFCGPCAAVHPKIDALLEQNKNVKVKIIFTTPNDESNKAYQPVSHLLAIAATRDEAKISQALDDWYLAREKNYEAFASKHPMNGELKNQGDKISAMSNWCDATDIKYTPTIFLNGRQLPNFYSVEDLQYFLLE